MPGTTTPGWLRLPGRYRFWGSLLLVLVSMLVISIQIRDRSSFANGDLRRDVMDRWGAPIVQPAPSVRWVESGSVFNTLHPLPLESQQVDLDVAMNYRKRGLIYFSGFDFGFRGTFGLRNPERHAIDVVFVFPIDVRRDRILLSDRTFLVDGRPVDIVLDEGSDKLVWTGRLEPGESRSLEIAFRGRGLDLFTYAMDPDLPARDFRLDVRVIGGRNYDYPPGVVPAHVVETEGEQLELQWRFASLESGVPVGMVLPSETSFDAVLLTMIRRSWATFVLFFAGIAALAIHREQQLLRHESYLIAAAYAFFFVLLAYLAAYIHFYAAYLIASVAIGGLLQVFLERTLSSELRLPIAGLIAGGLTVPTLAVILQNYTGLIYALEILAALALLMSLTTRPAFRTILYQLEVLTRAKETSHAG